MATGNATNAGDKAFEDKHRDDRIYVQIAAYREPDCQHTVQDLFSRAKYPDRVTVGICWQFVPGEDDDCFQITFPAEKVRTVEFHARESKGVEWARNETCKMWCGEEYRLQIDAHMRFVQDWDSKMFDCIDQCPSPRPLLSTYPLAFRPPRDLSPDAIIRMRARKFTEAGDLKFHGAVCSMKLAQDPPFPSAFAAAGFLFGSAQTIVDIPHDSDLYFGEEETPMSVRLWTHGWDIFSPNQVLIYHDYVGAPQRPKHWSDNKDWQKMQKRSVARALHLLGTKTTTDPEVIRNLDKYGLGKERTLAEYEAFAGVNFRKQTITLNGKRGLFGEHASPEGMQLAEE